MTPADLERMLAGWRATVASLQPWRPRPLRRAGCAAVTPPTWRTGLRLGVALPSSRQESRVDDATGRSGARLPCWPFHERRPASPKKSGTHFYTLMALALKKAIKP